MYYLHDCLRHVFLKDNLHRNLHHNFRIENCCFPQSSGFPYQNLNQKLIRTSSWLLKCSNNTEKDIITLFTNLGLKSLPWD
jgi:hypothetical protein